MRLISAVCVVTCLLPLWPLPAQSQASTAFRAPRGDSLLALDRRWGQAYVHPDSAVVAGVVAADWRGWSDDRSADTASVMEQMRSGAPRRLEDIVDQATVRVFGSTAVIEARERNRIPDSKGGHWETRHITDVLIHRRKGWVVVASHDSRIPNP